MPDREQIDGRSAIIIRQGCRGFHGLECGRLNDDGETLSPGKGESRRVFPDDELESLMPVAAGNHIPERRGFDVSQLLGTDA